MIDWYTPFYIPVLPWTLVAPHHFLGDEGMPVGASPSSSWAICVVHLYLGEHLIQPISQNLHFFVLATSFQVCHLGKGMKHVVQWTCLPRQSRHLHDPSTILHPMQVAAMAQPSLVTMSSIHMCSLPCCSWRKSFWIFRKNQSGGCYWGKKHTLPFQISEGSIALLEAMDQTLEAMDQNQ